MATGIEIAGLVLAALPFAIEGIKFYANGARTMKEMRHHQHVLDEFSRELDMEKVKFVNTCLNLLEDTVTSDVMSKLMNDPTGDLWKGNDLQEKLCDRLRSHSVPHFVQAMETMKKVIDELNEKFGIDENTSSKRASKRLRKKFTLALLRAYREEQLSRIRNINDDLDRLVNGTRHWADQRSTVPNKSIATRYNRIRNHAVALYQVLREKLQTPHCKCPSSHDVNLQLETHKTENVKPKAPESELRFKLIFSFDPGLDSAVPLNWRKLELEHIDEEHQPNPLIKAAVIHDGDEDHRCGQNPSSFPAATVERTTFGLLSPTTAAGERNSTTDPPKRLKRVAFFQALRFERSPTRSLSLVTTACCSSDGTSEVAQNKPAPEKSEIDRADIIQNFCFTIQKAKCAHSCLGVLIDEMNKKHYVWLPSSQSLLSHSATTVTLETLLSRQRPSRKERLALGVKLASSVVQLHGTGWLSEGWCNRDIVFLCDSADSTKALIEAPLVRRRLGSALTSNSVERSGSQVVRCNRTLLSLGIVLLELWFWEKLEDIHRSCYGDGVPTSTTDTGAYVIADELITHLYNDALENYGDAVRRCIRGLDHRETDLEKDDYKREVCEKIIGPLEENLARFC